MNVLVAYLDADHVHHAAAEAWFDQPGLDWALCAFTEAGVVRFFTRPGTGSLSVEQITAMLAELKREPGYRYVPIAHDWQTLTTPFARRLHGHHQVTDAFLLGLAVREGLVLTTFDRGLLHMAGPLREHVLVLGS